LIILHESQISGFHDETDPGFFEIFQMVPDVKRDGKMKWITIDEDKCGKEGICVEECPMVFLRLRNDNGYPEPAGIAICW